MNKLVNRMIKFTKEGNIVWHKAKKEDAAGFGKDYLIEYFQVAHCERKNCGFGCAALGFRKESKTLCLYIFFEAGKWLYINAEKENKIPIENLFSMVKNIAIKKKHCPRCANLHKIFSEQYK